MSRSVIFSDEKTITVRLSKTNRNPVYLTIDGDQGARLHPGEWVEIRRSARQLRLVMLKQMGFTEILNNKFKLHWTDEPEDGSPDCLSDCDTLCKPC